ncbi:MAG TPA: hypothetical protein VIH31_02395 [Candidatus Paceibacterota bacterium]
MENNKEFQRSSFAFQTEGYLEKVRDIVKGKNKSEITEDDAGKYLDFSSLMELHKFTPDEIKSNEAELKSISDFFSEYPQDYFKKKLENL